MLARASQARATYGAEDSLFHSGGRPGPESCTLRRTLSAATTARVTTKAARSVADVLDRVADEICGPRRASRLPRKPLDLGRRLEPERDAALLGIGRELVANGLEHAGDVGALSRSRLRPERANRSSSSTIIETRSRLRRMAPTALCAAESPSSLRESTCKPGENGPEWAQHVVCDATGELLQLRRARLLDELEPLEDALVPPHQHRRDQSADQRERRPEQVERVDQPQRPAADLRQAFGSVAGPARSAASSSIRRLLRLPAERRA